MLHATISSLRAFPELLEAHFAAVPPTHLDWRPRSWLGNASVRMAEELPITSAPPTPWPMRMAISHSAADDPLIHVTESRIEQTVNTARPRLNMRTRP